MYHFCHHVYIFKDKVEATDEKLAYMYNQADLTTCISLALYMTAHSGDSRHQEILTSHYSQKGSKRIPSHGL